MRKTGFQSEGYDPAKRPTCATCGSFEHKPGETEGRCANKRNFHPPVAGIPEGFRPYVTATGGCERHTNPPRIIKTKVQN